MRRWLSLGLVLLACFPRLGRAAEGMMSVALFQKDFPREITITSQQGMQVLDEKGKPLLPEQKTKTPLVLAWHSKGVHIASAPGLRKYFPSLLIKPRSETAPLFVGYKGIALRPYSGEVTVRAAGQTLLIVNRLPLEHYTAAVVSLEMPASWPLEALKAQAVVSRTYALKNLRQRHQAQSFAFCDLAHCQVYQGSSQVTEEVKTAVRQTQGQVLRHQGNLINAVYHSSCGGHTAPAAEVWPESDAPYLAGVDDRGPHGIYCQAAPEFKWETRITIGELEKMLASRQPRWAADPVVRIANRSTSGRVLDLQISAAGTDLRFTGDEWYRLWGQSRGWHQLKSANFEVAQKDNTWVFAGHGLGHGVGMCQWGNRARALQGQSYRKILSAYFAGCQVAE